MAQEIEYQFFVYYWIYIIILKISFWRLTSTFQRLLEPKSFLDLYFCIHLFLRISWFHFLNVLNKVQNNLLCARHWWQDIRHLGPLGYSERCTNMVKTKSGKRMFKKNRDYSFQAFDDFSLVLIISKDDFFSSHLIQETSNQTGMSHEYI